MPFPLWGDGRCAPSPRRLNVLRFLTPLVQTAVGPFSTVFQPTFNGILASTANSGGDIAASEPTHSCRRRLQGLTVNTNTNSEATTSRSKGTDLIATVGLPVSGGLPSVQSAGANPCGAGLASARAPFGGQDGAATLDGEHGLERPASGVRSTGRALLSFWRLSRSISRSGPAEARHGTAPMCSSIGKAFFCLTGLDNSRCSKV